MAIVPYGNPTPKKLPSGGGEGPTFRTARAQRTVRPHIDIQMHIYKKLSNNAHHKILPAKSTVTVTL